MDSVPEIKIDWLIDWLIDIRVESPALTPDDALKRGTPVSTLSEVIMWPSILLNLR